jgi:hypothetical protein
MVGWRYAIAAMLLTLSPVLALAQPAGVEETRLGEFPEQWLGEPVMSDNELHMAGVVAVGAKMAAWYDGKVGPAYDGIAKGHPVLSPDGSRYAYDACTGDWTGGRHQVVVDGAAGPECDAVYGPMFSEDGTRVAYLAWVGGRVRLMCDGQQVAEADGFTNASPTFYAGNKLAYQVRRGDRWQTVVEGVAGPEFDEVAEPVWDDDSKQLIYRGRRGEGWVWVVNGRETADPPPVIQDGHVLMVVSDGDKQAVSLDGVRGPLFDSIVGAPVLNKDGRTLAYVAGSDAGKRVVVNGVPGPLYEDIHYTGPVVSSTGRVAYVARRNDLWWFVVDGKESAKGYDDMVYYWKLASLCFSDDGRHYAFGAQRRVDVPGAQPDAPERQTRAVIVVDGVEGPEYDWIGPVIAPLFLPGDEGVTYIGHKGDRATLVLNGKVTAQAESFELYLGEGNRLVAYLSRQGGKWSVNFQGKSGAPYDGIEDLEVSADGKHVVYHARKGEGALAVADGVEGPLYDSILQGPSFAATGSSFAYMAQKGGKRCMVVNGVAGPLYDDVSGLGVKPVSAGFSPDGRHFAYAAAKDGKEFVVVDSVVGPAWDRILGDVQVHWRPDGSLEWLGLRDRVLYRVRLAAP